MGLSHLHVFNLANNHVYQLLKINMKKVDGGAAICVAHYSFFTVCPKGFISFSEDLDFSHNCFYH